MSNKLLVRFEGFQDNGRNNKFPMFTVLIGRVDRGSDGAEFISYEPSTTVSAQTLRKRYNVGISNIVDPDVKKGTILEFPIREVS